MAAFPLWPFELVDWGRGDNYRRLERDMERLLGRPRLTTIPFPPVNLWTASEEAVLSAEIPGVKADDIDLSIQDDILTLRCMREMPSLGDGDVWHRQERGHGEFVRAVTLPFRVKADAVEASYANGVLRVKLPQAEEEKARKVQVKAG